MRSCRTSRGPRAQDTQLRYPTAASSIKWAVLYSFGEAREHAYLYALWRIMLKASTVDLLEWNYDVWITIASKDMESIAKKLCAIACNIWYVLMVSWYNVCIERFMYPASG